MRFARLIAAALAGVAAIVASGAGPAGAHEEVPGVRAVLDSVDPPLPDGVVVQARISVADQLLVENRTDTNLFVLGDEGEPFLRIGPDGTYANVKSPAWFRSNDPTGAAVPPEDVDPKAEPVWARVTSEPVWGWFDHRLHRGQLTRPPPVEDPDKPVVLEEWTVPMRYGDMAVSVKGHREYQFPSGFFTSRVVGHPPELDVFALNGVVPAVTVVRTSSGGPMITVLGAAGEPMLRWTADGVEANEASPTWVFSQEAKGGYRRTGAVDAVGAVGANEAPRWVRLPSPQVTWLDRRGQLAVEGHEPEIGDSKVWRVPVLIGERRAEIVAETRYGEMEARPVPNDDGGGDGGGWPWWQSVLIGGAAGVAVTLLRGKLRLTRPSSSEGDRA